jgi:hypothetical protein
MSEPKRRLKIDLEELKFVMESRFDEMWHYLDLETGEIVLVTQDARRASEALLETIAPDISDAEAIAAIETANQAETVSDSEKAELRAAALVEIGYNTCFIEIPQVDSREGYQDMEAFIETVSNRHVRELLEVAIRGKGAFRRFKDVLNDHPAERERWFKFKDAQWHQRALEWLDDEGIEPIPSASDRRSNADGGL